MTTFVREVKTLEHCQSGEMIVQKCEVYAVEVFADTSIGQSDAMSILDAFCIPNVK